MRYKWERLGAFVFSSFLIIATDLVSALPTPAAVLYVDKDNSCPGAGTTGSPYCSIQNAFNASLSPGDHIRIRDAASAYDGNAVLTGKSGSSGNNIVIEPDTGANPTIRYTGKGAQKAALEIRDSSYVTVQNLNFVGTGISTSRYAIWFQASKVDVQGAVVAGNTITDWGGSETDNESSPIGIWYSNSGGSQYIVKNSIISNNMISGVRHASIATHGAANITISGNEISNIKCGRVSDGSVDALGIFLDSDSSAPSPANNSTGIIIQNNVIHDSSAFSSCGMTNQLNAVWGGIWADVNVDRGQILNNIIHDVDPGKTTTSNPNGLGVDILGILIESRCDNWIVRENLIYRIGVNGIRNGSDSTGDPNSNQYISNSIYSVGQVGIVVNRGNTLTLKNNIVQAAGLLAVQFALTNQGPHVIDYNNWYSSNSNRIGKWGSSCTAGTNCTFASWKSAIQAATGQSTGDSHSISPDPIFVNLTRGSEDFHLQSASPAIKAGEGGVDMGAYCSTGVSIGVSLLPSPTGVTVK